MKLIFVIILIVHGLVHLYGFANEWFLNSAPQICWKKIIYLSHRTSKAVGIIWLLTSLIFLFSAGGLAMDTNWWKMLTIIGVIISQLLIFLYIKYAWTSTLANILIIAGIVWLL